jgi:hypothetical protein
MIKNLTPHDLHLVIDGAIHTIPRDPDAVIPRVVATPTVIGAVDGIPLTTVVLGAPEGVPDPVDGVFYVVSAMLRDACPTRKDLLSPGDVVRDADGKIIGCKSLVQNP